MELYNIYLKQKVEKAQIINVIDKSQINLLFNAIAAKKESVIIDGRTIYLFNIEVINIFDVSKSMNTKDKAGLKNEMRLMKGRLSGTDLLSSFGYDITHEFEIPNYHFNLAEDTIYDDILNCIHSNGFEAFSKDSPSYRLKAIRELEAFKLISKNGNSYILEEEGFRAIELGGFSKWKEYKNEIENKFGHISIIQGDGNNINQLQGNNVYNSNVSQINEQPQKSWLEKISWIAGIIGVLITIYQLLK